MKIEQEAINFNPINIALESAEEVEAMLAILDIVTDSGADTAQVKTFANRLDNQLSEIHGDHVWAVKKENIE